MEMLQSSKWEKISQKLGGVVWTTNVEGTRYFLEEVSMNSPCYAIDQVNPALTRPVVRQLMIHAGKNGNPCDHDIDQPIYIGLAKAESKKKRKK